MLELPLDRYRIEPTAHVLGTTDEFETILLVELLLNHRWDWEDPNPRLSEYAQQGKILEFSDQRWSNVLGLEPLSKVDPGEILHEYRTTRFPDRFYRLKIGIPWADLERRLDMMTVLSLCTETPMEEKAGERGTGSYSMGVDTGSELHVVILKRELGGEDTTNGAPAPRLPRHLPQLRGPGRAHEALSDL